MKTIQLSSNVSIPALGLGTWKLNDKECVDAITSALGIGYRHIDTADAYNNHTEVGKAIEASGIDRSDIFLTTKIWRDSLEKSDVKKTVERFLRELGTDYIDLLLIHWPNRDIEIDETLEAMHKAKEDGKVRAIGVSNFTTHHLEDALETGFEITNNQVELHPNFKQSDLRQFCSNNNISVTAYSPLGRGESLEIPLIKDLANKYNASKSQVILNWMTSRNTIAIPKSSSKDRLKENLESTSFEIDEDDLKKIDELPDSNRLIDPSFSDFDY